MMGQMRSSATATSWLFSFDESSLAALHSETSGRPGGTSAAADPNVDSVGVVNCVGLAYPGRLSLGKEKYARVSEE